VGFAQANNQAIRQSQGRYVLLLNSDAQLVPGALSRMVDFLNENPSAGIVSVCLAFPDKSPQFCYGRFPSLGRELRPLFGLHHWDLSPWGKSTPQKVDWVSGACLMARRTMLNQIGLLDEDSFMFGEEVDLCLRASKASWGVYIVPSRPVIHVRAGSTGKTPERTVRLYLGKIVYARKHFGHRKSRLLAVMMLVSVSAKVVYFGMGSWINGRWTPQYRFWLETLQQLLRERGLAYDDR
jgi:GT2 family glycosyltransferase